MQPVVGAAQFAVEQGHGQIVQAAAAERLRHVGGVEPHCDRPFLDLRDKVRPDLAGALDLFLVWVEFLLHESAGGFDNQFLFFGEREFHDVQVLSLGAQFGLLEGRLDFPPARE